MAETTPEVIARAIRWCADAGRQVSEEEMRAALSPLSWDELLATQALIADPPPAQPLGPRALADIARGTPPEVAAEREREGRYRPESAFAPLHGEAAPPPPRPPSQDSRPRRRSPAEVRVRRARDRAAAPAPVAPALPFVDVLFAPEGRAILERLIREHGARRARILAVLAEGYRRADDAPLCDADLDALLDMHGLARSFRRRERDLVLHVLRAEGGVRPRAAAQLGVSAEAFGAALARLGADREAAAIREERRGEILARATLSERVHLLVHDEERLADLGVLDTVVEDLRARLPEHVKALRASGARSLVVALGRSLSVSRPAVETLAARLGLELPSPRPGGAAPARLSPAPVRTPGRSPSTRRVERPRGRPARTSRTRRR